MGKVSIAVLDGDPVAAEVPPDEHGLGAVTTKALFARQSQSLLLRYQFLAPGGALQWTNARADHCVFVIGGAIDVGGVHIDEGGVVIVEHGGSALVESAGGAMLAVFEAKCRPERSGGNVHAILHGDVPRKDRFGGDPAMEFALFAASDCPTCALWLHENRFGEDFETGLHSHSEDEIMLVIKGEMILGRRHYGPGTAVAIAKNTVYGFRAGRGGLRFVNFRASSPTYRRHGTDDDIDEAAILIEQVGRPGHIPLGAPLPV
ncbi:MAG TPA: hypothetical protein VJ859_01980 [Allosphingosinicella sp.]|nr:hypothetical protein [Allosphingosinicella sp.]